MEQWESWMQQSRGLASMNWVRKVPVSDVELWENAKGNTSPWPDGSLLTRAQLWAGWGSR